MMYATGEDKVEVQEFGDKKQTGGYYWSGMSTARVQQNDMFSELIHAGLYCRRYDFKIY
jgi:hypothetical protein